MNVAELLADSPFAEKAEAIAQALANAGVNETNLDDAPRKVGGHPAGADVYQVVEHLQAKLKAAEPETETKPESGTINLADGVTPAEATLAGRTLAQTKRQRT